MTRFALSLLLSMLFLAAATPCAFAQTTLPPGAHDTGIAGVIRVTPEGTEEVGTQPPRDEVPLLPPVQETRLPEVVIVEPIPAETVIVCPPGATVAVPAAVPDAQPIRPLAPADPLVTVEPEPPIVIPPPPAATRVTIDPEPELPMAEPEFRERSFTEDDFAVLPPAGTDHIYWVLLGAVLVSAGTAYRIRR